MSHLGISCTLKQENPLLLHPQKQKREEVFKSIRF